MGNCKSSAADHVSNLGELDELDVSYHSHASRRSKKLSSDFLKNQIPIEDHSINKVELETDKVDAVDDNVVPEPGKVDGTKVIDSYSEPLRNVCISPQRNSKPEHDPKANDVHVSLNLSCLATADEILSDSSASLQTSPCTYSCTDAEENVKNIDTTERVTAFDNNETAKTIPAKERLKSPTDEKQGLPLEENQVYLSEEKVDSPTEEILDSPLEKKQENNPEVVDNLGLYPEVNEMLHILNNESKEPLPENSFSCIEPSSSLQSSQGDDDSTTLRHTNKEEKNTVRTPNKHLSKIPIHSPVNSDCSSTERAVTPRSRISLIPSAPLDELLDAPLEKKQENNPEVVKNLCLYEMLHTLNNESKEPLPENSFSCIEPSSSLQSSQGDDDSTTLRHTNKEEKNTVRTPNKHLSKIPIHSPVNSDCSSTERAVTPRSRISLIPSAPLEELLDAPLEKKQENNPEVVYNLGLYPEVNEMLHTLNNESKEPLPENSFSCIEPSSSLQSSQGDDDSTTLRHTNKEKKNTARTPNKHLSKIPIHSPVNSHYSSTERAVTPRSRISLIPSLGSTDK